MNDKTESDLIADEQKDFVPDRDIVAYDRDELDADALYDVRQEAEHVDAVALAARVEIERQNYITFEDYRPAFAQHELLDIGMMLMSAKEQRLRDHQSDRVERIKDLSSAFLSGYDIDPSEMDVEQVDELPTIDD